MRLWRHGFVLLVAALAFALAGCSGGGGGDDDSGGGGDDVAQADSGGDTAAGDCGNGVVDPGEDCDGIALGGGTCESVAGVAGGTLGCKADCTYDTTGCEGPSPCGNGAIDTGEECDGTELGGATCESQGFESGTLACTGACAFDTTGCVAAQDCGNGVVDAGEDCDGTELDGATCESQGFDGGTLACGADCTFDTGDCTDSDCGNGQLDVGEQCDGVELNGATCVSLDFAGGELACGDDCQFDTTNCAPADECGNGAVDTGEDCDGTELNGATCESQGFDGGTLACAGNCTFDTTNCTSDDCGNGAVDAGEDCDGTELNGATCESQGFDGGTLACAGNCTFDTTNCTSDDCGNGAVDAGEDCDGTELNGATCVSEGFDGGTLACAGNCTFDTTNCTSDDCGNGAVDAGEDCDGTDLNGATCVSEGFDGGTLECTDGCTFDTTGCESAPDCGNDLVEDGEECDGAALAGATCESLGFDSGTLGCTDACEYDTNDCVAAPECGDDSKDIGEDCDGADLGDATCLSLGFAAGTLACTDACSYDYTDCTHCGDDIIDEGEACDGANLNATQCADLGYDGGTLSCQADCTFDESLCEGCPEDEYEENDDAANATVFIAPGTLDAYLCNAADDEEDWYTLDLMAGDRIVVDVTFDDDALDIDIEVWADPADDAPLASSGGSSDVETIIGEIPETGDYLLRVYGYSAGQSAYTIVVRTEIECFVQEECAAETYCDEDGSWTCLAGCLDDDNCGDGTICVENACVAGCRGDADCAAGEVCFELACTVPGCRENADCALGEACVDYTCTETACTEDADCADYDLVCDTTSGACVECLDVTDCPNDVDFLCTANVCDLQCTDDMYEPSSVTEPAALSFTDDAIDLTGLALCGNRTSDWYVVTLQPGMRYVFEASFVHADGDVDIYLHSVDDPTTDLRTSAGSSNTERFVWDVPDEVATDYVLEVFLFSSSVYTQTYDLSILGFVVECEANSECAVGQYCDLDAYACVDTTCAADADCADYGLVCDEAAGFCAECGDDADCGAREACVDNVCAFVCVDDEYEENDTYESPTQLAVGQYELNLCDPEGTEEDWYVVDVSAGENIAVLIQFDDDLGDLELDLYTNPTDVSIDSSHGVDDDELVAYTADANATMYIKVYLVGSGGNAYTMTIVKNPPCVADDVCEAGEICLEFACTAGCRSDAACGDGEICQAYECVPGCRYDSDCLETEICDANVCITGCRYDSDCADGEVCDDAHACIVPDCLENADCALGEACVDYACVGTMCVEDADCADYGLVCDEAAEWCAECAVDEDCGANQTCIDNACVFGCVDDAFEENDARDAAASVDIQLYEGLALCEPPDATEEDWYVVDLMAGEAIIVDLTFTHATADLELKLIGANGAEIDSSTSSTDNEQVEGGVVDDGPVYIRVYSSGTGRTAPYDMNIQLVDCVTDAHCGLGETCEAYECVLATCVTDADCATYGLVCDEAAEWCVECTVDDDCGTNEVCTDYRCAFACDDDVYEENDTRETAAAVTVGTYDALALCEPAGGTEEDWYAIDLVNGDILSVDILFTHATADLELKLFNGEGTQLASSVSSTNDEHVEYSLTADMTVYIQVYSSGTGKTAPYSMEIALRSCAPDAYDGNGTSADAASITIPFDEMGLTLCGEDAEDWFVFDLAPETSYLFTTLFTDADGDIDVKLYAAANLTSAVASGTTGSDDEVFAYTTDINGGTYYLAVILYSGAVQTYDLNIDTIDCVQDEDCAALQACVEGTCVDVDCLEDADCAALQVCVANTCIDVECATDGDCEAGQICLGNTCLAAGAGESCDTAIPVTTFPYALAGFPMDGYANDVQFVTGYPNSCTGWGTGGNDVVFQVDLLAGQTVFASVDGNFDEAIYIATECGTTLADDVCLDGEDNGSPEEATYTASAAMTVYVVVDYYSSGGPSAGSVFDLTINVTGP